MLYLHMWQIGRQQPRTLSMQQCHTSRKKTRKAANLKGALCQSLTQENFDSVGCKTKGTARCTGEA